MTKRLLQVFLSFNGSAPAIFEVNIDKSETLTCTCPGFKSKDTCKHVKYVDDQMDMHDGMYPFDFITDATMDQVKTAMKTEQGFRDFVIKNVRVQVL